MLMDLEYPDNHRKNQLYLSITCTAKVFNGGERRYIPQRYLTLEEIGNLLVTQSSIETFSENLLFFLMKTLSKHVQLIVV